MGTVIVGAIVLGVVGLAVRSIMKDKKSGKGCNGNCGSCGGNIFIKVGIKTAGTDDKLGQQFFS